MPIFGKKRRTGRKIRAEPGKLLVEVTDNKGKPLLEVLDDYANGIDNEQTRALDLLAGHKRTLPFSKTELTAAERLFPHVYMPDDQDPHLRGRELGPVVIDEVPPPPPDPPEVARIKALMNELADQGDRELADERMARIDEKQ